MEAGKTEVLPYVSGRADRRGESRPFARVILKGLSQSCRELRKVGKQDSAVELESSDRLESDFGGMLWRVAQAEHAAGSFAGDIILGKVAPSLTH